MALSLLAGRLEISWKSAAVRATAGLIGIFVRRILL
jgi:hypothetical protein